jgi:hypothetical protein
VSDDITVLKFKCPVFGSEGDEQSFFKWLGIFTVEVIGVHDSIEIKFRNDQDNLREAIAIYYRYKLPMQDLARLVNGSNSHWFKCEGKFWYEQVFGKE